MVAGAFLAACVLAFAQGAAAQGYGQCMERHIVVSGNGITVVSDTGTDSVDFPQPPAPSPTALPRAHCESRDRGESMCRGGLDTHTIMNRMSTTSLGMPKIGAFDFTQTVEGVEAESRQVELSGTGHKGGVVSIGDVDRDGINDVAWVMVQAAPDAGENVIVVATLNSFVGDDGLLDIKEVSSFSLKDIDSSLEQITVTGAANQFNLHSLTAVGDVNGDGFVDLAFIAPYWKNGSGPHGGVFIVFLDDVADVVGYSKIGVGVGGFAVDANDFDVVVTGDNQAGFSSLAYLGDMVPDSDHAPEILIGNTEFTQAGATGSGVVWVVTVNQNGAVAHQYALDSDDLCGDDNCGYSIAVLGDVDGNDVPDLAVTGKSMGKIAVTLMEADAGLYHAGTRVVSNIGSTLTSPIPSSRNILQERFGVNVFTVGDIDMDGTVDLLVGSPRCELAGGVLELYLLKPSGQVKNQLWELFGSIVNRPSAATPQWQREQVGLGSSAAILQLGTPEVDTHLLVGIPGYTETGCTVCGELAIIRTDGCGSKEALGFPVDFHTCDEASHIYPDGAVPTPSPLPANPSGKIEPIMITFEGETLPMCGGPSPDNEAASLHTYALRVCKEKGFLGYLHESMTFEYKDTAQDCFRPADTGSTPEDVVEGTSWEKISGDVLFNSVVCSVNPGKCIITEAGPPPADPCASNQWVDVNVDDDVYALMDDEYWHGSDDAAPEIFLPEVPEITIGGQNYPLCSGYATGFEAYHHSAIYALRYCASKDKDLASDYSMTDGSQECAAPVQKGTMSDFMAASDWEVVTHTGIIGSVTCETSEGEVVVADQTGGTTTVSECQVGGLTGTPGTPEIDIGGTTYPLCGGFASGTGPFHHPMIYSARYCKGQGKDGASAFTETALGSGEQCAAPVANDGSLQGFLGATSYELKSHGTQISSVTCEGGTNVVVVETDGTETTVANGCASGSGPSGTPETPTIDIGGTDFPLCGGYASGPEGYHHGGMYAMRYCVGTAGKDASSAFTEVQLDADADCAAPVANSDISTFVSGSDYVVKTYGSKITSVTCEDGATAIVQDPNGSQTTVTQGCDGGDGNTGTPETPTVTVNGESLPLCGSFAVSAEAHHHGAMYAVRYCKGTGKDAASDFTEEILDAPAACAAPVDNADLGSFLSGTGYTKITYTSKISSVTCEGDSNAVVEDENGSPTTVSSNCQDGASGETTTVRTPSVDVNGESLPLCGGFASNPEPYHHAGMYAVRYCKGQGDDAASDFTEVELSSLAACAAPVDNADINAFLSGTGYTKILYASKITSVTCKGGWNADVEDTDGAVSTVSSGCVEEGGADGTDFTSPTVVVTGHGALPLCGGFASGTDMFHHAALYSMRFCNDAKNMAYSSGYTEVDVTPALCAAPADKADTAAFVSASDWVAVTHDTKMSSVTCGGTDGTVSVEDTDGTEHSVVEGTCGGSPASVTIGGTPYPVCGGYATGSDSHHHSAVYALRYCMSQDALAVQDYTEKHVSPADCAAPVHNPTFSGMVQATQWEVVSGFGRHITHVLCREETEGVVEVTDASDTTTEVTNVPCTGDGDGAGGGACVPGVAGTPTVEQEFDAPVTRVSGYQWDIPYCGGYAVDDDTHHPGVYALRFCLNKGFDAVLDYAERIGDEEDCAAPSSASSLTALIQGSRYTKSSHSRTMVYIKCVKGSGKQKLVDDAGSSTTLSNTPCGAASTGNCGVSRRLAEEGEIVVGARGNIGRR